MLTTHRLTLTVALGVLAAGAWAQSPARRGPDPNGPPPDEIPLDGFWPTPRMMDRMMDRIADSMVGHYGLDDDQLYQTRELFKSRFPQWLAENRPALQRLTNEYFEALLNDQPPTPEEVADWAARAQPLWQGFAQVFEETTEDMRSYLTDEQQTILDGEVAVWGVAKGHVTNRFQVWSEGGYDAETEWPRGEGFRDQKVKREQEFTEEAIRAKNTALGVQIEAAEAGGAAGAAGGQAPTPTSQPAVAGKVRDEWVEYTENFIRRYNLDDAQQNTAHTILASLQEQRDRYLRRRLPEIEKLEKKLVGARSEDDRARIRIAYQRIQEPLDRYFQQLKDRLDKLPTRIQRVDAAQSEPPGAAKAEASSKTTKRTGE